MSLAAAIREYDAARSSSDSISSQSTRPSSLSSSIVASDVVDDSASDDASSSSRSAAYMSTASKGKAAQSLRAAMYGTPDGSVPQLRKYEHHAVLMDRNLWKSDAQATVCDTWNCRTQFSLFERRHHCRKCGGVFCAAHSSRTTLLLDSRRMPTLYPPRGQPITAFNTPLTPVAEHRVCDGCHDMLHGVPTLCKPSPADERLFEIPPQLMPQPKRRASRGTRSSASASPVAATPPDGAPLPRLSSKAKTASSGSLPRPARRNTAPVEKPTPVPLDASFCMEYSREDAAVKPSPPAPGPLDKYPLREHSSLCKTKASARWRSVTSHSATPSAC